MIRAVHAVILGAALISWIPGHAFASAWDNAPASWRAERNRNLRPAFESPGDISTTSSIRRELPRHSIERRRPAGAS